MRLRRSSPDRPGITRRRRGAGFSYASADGSPVDAATRERIAHLAIPPAWRDVWISPYEGGHIQAVGTDDAGRRQYLYHEQWRLDRDEAKHDRVLKLGRRLPRIRESVETDLQLSGVPRARVLAVALRMLDAGAMRVGSEQYLEEHGTHGVCTLLREQVCVVRGDVVLDFTAKGGIDRSLRLTDPALARAIGTLRRSRHDLDRLLVFRDGRQWRPVHSDDVNERFKQLAGDGFTVKDLRTWQATVVAAVALGQVNVPKNKTARARAERAAVEQVAQTLGNTPAVARRSYVDPRVITAFDEGQTLAAALDRIGSDDLADPATRLAIERAVVRLLSRQ